MFLAILAMLASGATDAGTPLQPLDQWRLDAGENSCVLERAFGEPVRKWSVGIRPHPGLPRSDLVLIPPSKSDSLASGEVTVTLRPSGRTFTGEIIIVPQDGGAPIESIALENALLDALPANTELSVGVGHGRTISFSLAGIGGATAALKSCGEGLLESWGVDPARFRPIVPPGQPGFVDMSKFLSSADTPRSIGSDEKNGRTVALLTLGVDGKVAGCRIVESSGTVALDERACQIALRRLHYPPARDSTGKPVTSWTMFAMKWVFP